MKKRLSIIAFLIASGMAAAFFLMPWNSMLEKRVLAMLESKGLQNVSMHIDTVGINKASLTDITIGKENPLRLRSLSLKYTIGELLGGNLQELALEGLELELRETEKGWALTGLDALPSQNGNKRSIDIPSMLASLPFSAISVTDGTLNISGYSLQGTVPFSATFAKSVFKLLTGPADLSIGNKNISLGAFAIDAAPDINKGWSGNWALSSLDPGQDLPVPPLKAAGNITAFGPTIHMDGDAYNDGKDYRGSLSAVFNLEKPQDNQIKLTSASFPFKEGRISTANVILKMPMTVKLQIQKVSVDALMQALTGKKVSATGTFSGSIPVTIKKDGGFLVGKGALNADTSGIIQMPPDAIPGDNAQIDLVRDVLENLQYSLLSANVDAAKGGKMTVRLNLEGKNPDVYNGRPIKLNVNLTGDLLDFVQQNIMLFNTPEKILERETR